MRPFNHGFFPGLLLGVALAVPSRAADNTPTLDSVLARFVEASGGKVAMDKITSRTLKGDLDLMGSTSDWVMYAKPPDKQLSECKHATLGALVDGFDGTVAWSKTDAGIRVKEGEELAKTRRDAEFYR